MDVERCCFRRNTEVAWSTLGDECVLVHVESHAYYSLNKQGKFLWELLGERKSLHEIMEEITEQYDVDAETAKRDLREILEDLINEGLVDCTEMPVTETGGICGERRIF